MNTVVSSVATEFWVETTLGERAEYITSGSRDWSRYYADSGAIFIRTQDINQNRLSLEEVAFVKLPEKVEGKRSLVRKGDLLITITGANVGKVAVVEAEIPEAYVSQSVCLVRLKDPSLAKFVHLQLTAKRGDKTTVESMAYGLGRPVLNLENIRSAPIRVAPAKVQTVIVAEIEKQFSRLDEAVANLKPVKANLKRYKASVLKAAVEGRLTEDWRKQHPNVEPASKLLERILAERRATWSGRGKYKEPAKSDTSNRWSLPAGWDWTSPDQLSKPDTNAICAGPFGTIFKAKDFRPVGVPIIFLRHVAPGRYLRHKPGFMDEKKWKELFEPYSVFGGELLVTKLGEPPGVCAIYPEGIGPAMVTPDVIKMSVNSAAILPKLMMHYLNSEIARRFATGAAFGTTRLRVTLPIFREMPVPLPPRAEQEQIVAEVERRLSIIEEFEAALEANLTRAARLRQSILGSAFSGQLIHQERN